MLNIMHIVGARPNYPKVAPLMAAMAAHPGRLRQLLVDTGQHYDYNMSQVFFEQLEMPAPDAFLKVGSASHAVQTAEVMKAFEPVVLQHRPDWVFVVGDVNSTLGCALVCSKLGVPVAHVEAGLRSNDRTMPEEINRLLTDQISDLLFTPSEDGNANLAREGIARDKVHLVGNIMIDSLVKMLPKARQRSTLRDLGLSPKHFFLATLHRPSNVDDPPVLREIWSALVDLAARMPVVFPVHPRTRARIAGLALQPPPANLRLVEPLAYLDFVALMENAALVLTDSGGVQEETTYLGVPCLTVRRNTERPATITEGTNLLVASRHDALVAAASRALQHTITSRRPPLWDGQTAARITEIMLAL